MSRRNTRQGKARRRAERGRRRVTERERKRPGTSDQGSRAVGDQVVQAVPRPDGSGPRNADEHGSALRSDADGGLIAVNLDEADLDSDGDLESGEDLDGDEDLESFDDLDADDADLQAVLAEEDLVEEDLVEEDLVEADIGDV